MPIEKIDNTILYNEFRPINILPPYKKLLEIIVKEQLLVFIEVNNILTKHQVGFRKSNSCETALQSVLVKWKSAINDKKNVGVVFFDFRRAFEIIDRDVLLKKLEKIGLRGTVLQWFRSYLSNRKQAVKFGNNISSSQEVQYGVPQGSVLGPILFLLYINDIAKVVQDCQIQMFADDTLLYCVGDDINVINGILNNELENIYEWLGRNSLNSNLEKTKCMVRKNKYCDSKSLNIVINNNVVENVAEFEYLGVIIDTNLSFSRHCEYVAKKVSKKVSFLSRMGKFLSTRTKLLVYKTIIAPHFAYCPTIMYMFSNNEFHTLQVIQSKVLRSILSCDRYTRVSGMLENLKVLSVKQSVMLNVFIFIYKLLNNMLPKHMLEFCTFVFNIHDYNTRDHQNFREQAHYMEKISNLKRV